ncbi:hypothetical protein E2C01_096671 [Portunus trituberculatus]|uniref:Uncharacterized protein n=1 Tax=Portunus trituberculatus TaxID=210409 RepID=A0A5B7K928_PORTR|nr:hypothetical protein [Portunus trituberculatus]
MKVRNGRLGISKRGNEEEAKEEREVWENKGETRGGGGGGGRHTWKWEKVGVVDRALLNQLYRLLPIGQPESRSQGRDWSVYHAPRLIIGAHLGEGGRGLVGVMGWVWSQAWGKA